MSDDAGYDSTPMGNVDTELRQLVGLFDTPAFARRGQELEHVLARLHDRCRRERAGMLDMVQVRLRQWSRAVTGPEAWPAAFDRPIEVLWPLAGAEPPRWADQPLSPRRIQTIAAELIASLERFNRRWSAFLRALDLDRANRLIDQYNKYYVLEKECTLGSPRLAARFFTPYPHLTTTTLLDEAQYPLLPVPNLVN
ncbi:hypothetical protein EP7_002791 [Isosphaeraceae bacterium EP7]